MLVRLEAQIITSLMRAGRNKREREENGSPSLSVLLNRDSKCSDDDTWRFLAWMEGEGHFIRSFVYSFDSIRDREGFCFV
jgi:hypothetical protein